MAFVILQLIMLAVVIGFPSLTLDALGPKQKIDIDNVKIELQESGPGEDQSDAAKGGTAKPESKSDSPPGSAPTDSGKPAEEDPEDLMKMFKNETKK